MLFGMSQPSYALSSESSRSASLCQRFIVLLAFVLMPALGPCPVTLLLGGGAREQPRLGFLERVHVAAVVCQNCTSGLYVAHSRQLQFEVDSVGLVLCLGFGDLSAQLLCCFCILGGLCHLRLERRDLLVALGNSFLLVAAAQLRLPLRRLLPEVFLGVRLFPASCRHVRHLPYRFAFSRATSNAI